MKQNRKNLTNKRFGKLVVLEPTTPIFYGKKKEQAYSRWKCICDCGKIKKIATVHLTTGGSTSCGCAGRATKPIGVSASNRLLSRYKNGAKRRNLKFNLTRKYFLYLTKLPCYYCGSLPSKLAIISSKRKYNGNYIYNGIDRKDNAKGYTKINSVTCCQDCNRMKYSSNYDLFLNHIKQIYMYRIHGDDDV